MGGSGLCTICGINFKRLDKHMKCVHDQTDEEVNCEFLQIIKVNIIMWWKYTKIGLHVQCALRSTSPEIVCKSMLKMYIIIKMNVHSAVVKVSSINHS